MPISKIYPCLWYPNPFALTAAEFYVNLFNTSPSTNKVPSSITHKSLNTKSVVDALKTGGNDMPGQPGAGEVLTVYFTLAGQTFMSLNGPNLPDKPQNSLFPFNEAISMSIDCESQEEVDHFYDGLVKDGGAEIECGWVKDKFGVHWQIVPARYNELLIEGNEGVKERLMAKMMKTKKPNIAEYEVAAKGGE
jgi:predicted 3-demethylubiquinone-9 3-methyltransferase (glyoxalase superfamily)